MFDGRSIVIDADGDVVARAAAFAEEVLVCDVDPGAARLGPPARHAAAPRASAHADRAAP